MRWYNYPPDFLHQLYSEFQTRYGCISKTTAHICALLINKVTWNSPNSVIRTKYILIKEAKMRKPEENEYYSMVIKAISNWQNGEREFELL